MEWYELNINDRYEQIYKKFSLVDFFYWWTDKDNPEYMEIRFEDWKLAKECSQKFFLKSNKASVFVYKPIDLINIIKEYRFKSHLWFGINPRRMLRNKWGKLGFTGKDINISKSKFLFIDIDRVVKNGRATSTDLMNADFLANKILEEFGNAGFNKNYIKICTGNGLQLILKLDIPFELPMPEFQDDGGIYIENSIFKDIKDIMKNGIGKVLEKFSSKFKDEYNVEIDTTGFNLGRIGALPYSMNLKYDKPTPRGIIELKNDESNEGFADYLRSLVKNSYQRIKSNKNFEKIGVVLSKDYEIIRNKMTENNLINLMLNYKFPDGGINNTLWNAIKILLFNKNITCHDKEYIDLHEYLKQLHNRSFSENGLEPIYKNNYNGPIKKNDINMVPFIVNKYLRLHKVQCIKTNKLFYHPPLFNVSPNGKHKQPINIELNKDLFKEDKQDIDFGHKYSFDKTMSDPLENLKSLYKSLFDIRNGDYISDSMFNEENNINDIGKLFIEKQIKKVIVNFLHDFFERWGKEMTLYMFKYYFNDYINYKRFY